MGKLLLTVTSKSKDLFYISAMAESPSFMAKTGFYCKGLKLVELGKSIKGFPKDEADSMEFSLGESKVMAEFHFRSVKNAGHCELWVKIKGVEDERGNSAESYFPIDYLDAAAIDNFSKELIRLGTDHSSKAEIKNRFEDA